MATQGVKRSAPESLEALEDVKAIIVDVDGTVTPPEFVKDVLAKYMKDNMKAYVEGRWESEEGKTDFVAFKDQAEKDKEVEGFVAITEGEQGSTIETLVSNISWQIDNNRKSDALTQFQTNMLREAYKAGKVQAKLFEDVAPAVREWVSEKRKVYGLSSDNVENQKLLFSNSSSGNIGDLFSGHFDRADKDSFKKIATDLSLDPAEIMLLTDKPSEAGPASEAGLKTSLVIREGSTALTDDDKQKFSVIETFSELTSASNGSAKRVEPEQKDAEAEESDEAPATEPSAPAKEPTEPAPAADSTEPTAE